MTRHHRRDNDRGDEPQDPSRDSSQDSDSNAPRPPEASDASNDGGWHEGEEPDETGYETDDDEEAGPDVPRFDSERMLRRMFVILEGRSFASQEEFEEFVKSPALRKAAEDLEGEMTLEEEAQELAYLAMESGDSEQAEKHARDGIALDPDCVDCRVVLAFMLTDDLKERVVLLERTIEVARMRLEACGGDDPKLKFLGMIETRPLLRALHALAETVAEAGDPDHAQKVYEEMLTLSCDENDDTPYLFLSFLLRQRRLERADRLMRKMNENENLVLVWARILERFLAGEKAAAAELLEKVRPHNFYVESLLLGAPEEPGAEGEENTEKEEAEVVHQLLANAWSGHEEAMDWLRAEAAAIP